MKGLSVPIDLMQFAFENKFVEELRLYLYLKSRFSSKGKLSKADKDDISKNVFDCSDRTLRKHLKALIKRDWISYDRKSRFYFIRGWKRVQNIESIPYISRCAKLEDINEDGFWNDKNRFKAFMAGAIIGKASNHSKYLHKKKSNSNDRRKVNKYERSMGDSLPKSYPFSPHYYPTSISFIQASFLDLPTSTISDYLGLAQKYGYIAMKENYESLGVPAKNISIYKMSHSDDVDSHKLIKRYCKTEGEVMICKQLPNLIKPFIKYIRVRDRKRA